MKKECSIYDVDVRNSMPMAGSKDIDPDYESLSMAGEDFFFYLYHMKKVPPSPVSYYLVSFIGE